MSFLFCIFSVEENDIIELEKRYWTIKALSRTGCLDLELFRQCVCPPLPETLCDGEHSETVNVKVNMLKLMLISGCCIEWVALT